MGLHLPIALPEAAETPARRSPTASARAARVSVTDRCDLACVYCRPHKRDGYVKETLDLGRWESMARGLLAAGIRRVRITGGEPLLSPDLVRVVALFASLGFDDLALTTNATRLEALARPLKEAGLSRLNVSLDSLDPARFRSMTRGGDLCKVLRGLDAAEAAGFRGTKLNTVVLRGDNEDELHALVDFAWGRGLTPRFLELMAIGEGAAIGSKLVPWTEVHRVLAARLLPGEPAREADRGPAVYLRASHDPSLRVGFITGATATYCEGCDRIRVAADGQIRSCLAKNDAVRVDRESGDGTDAVGAAIAEAWKSKPDATFQGCTEASAKSVSMRGVGG